MYITDIDSIASKISLNLHKLILYYGMYNSVDFF